MDTFCINILNRVSHDFDLVLKKRHKKSSYIWLIPRTVKYIGDFYIDMLI